MEESQQKVLNNDTNVNMSIENSNSSHISAFCKIDEEINKVLQEYMSTHEEQSLSEIREKVNLIKKFVILFKRLNRNGSYNTFMEKISKSINESLSDTKVFLNVIFSFL